MKKNKLKTLLAILIVPILLFCGCKNKELPAIELSRYLNESLTISRHLTEEKTNETIDFIATKNLDKANLSKYTKFEFSANSVWMYKMYVEYISFYVYTNEASQYEMILNLKMSDLADESEILKSNTDSIEVETIEKQCTIKPQKDHAIKCTFPIGKTVARALGADISIDILNSLELYSDDDETFSFKWLIYGLEIHGESRTYSK